MSEQRLQVQQWLPRPRAEVFSFFAAAANLQTITPPWVRFAILTPLPIEMRVGALIHYKLRIRGFPVYWETEITAWEPPLRFVDVQRKGPYRQWIHEHRFEEQDGGTLVIDDVRYRAPGGRLIEWLLVKPEVERIFAFRRQRMAELFPG